MSFGSNRSWMWMVLTMLALTACGDDDGGAVETVTQLIGPEGGTVELAGGGKVEIPPGALDEDTSITISKLPENNTLADLPDNLEPAGKPFAFKPHGLQFAEPVKVEIPFTGNGTGVRPVKLPNEEPDQDPSDWTTVAPSTKDTVNSKVSGNVTSFSVIMAARPRRNSNVITLLDGAIDDGSMPAGEGGSGGTSGSGGMAGNAGEGGTAGDAGAGGTSGTAGDASVAGTGGVGGDDAGVVGGTGGTDDGGVTCNGTICNGTCIDTNNDAAHCGACGHGCGEGEGCVDGLCECPMENRCTTVIAHDGDAGLDMDAGVESFMCADLDHNRYHCGDCDTACVTGETCVSGTCTPIVCGGGDIRCGDDCVDPQTDLNNCGGCGRRTSDDELGMLCYIEDYYCESDCSYYGGTLCATTQPSYSECVDLAIDRTNCGACGTVCSASQVCNDGVCDELTCGNGEVACNGACVSGDSCGESCGNNETCDEASCACNSGTTACLDGCVDTNTDDHNCGDCGTECDYGESCIDGVCDCAGVNPAVCEGYCSDLDSDNYNCGSCFNYCYAGEQCVAGVCEPAPCEGNQVRCDGQCVDTSSNVFHCGGCAPSQPEDPATCLRFETCICSEYGLTECAINQAEAVCTDTAFDRDHCGVCGNACATGSECVDGTCQAVDCGNDTLCGNECVESPTCGVQCDYGKGELCGAGGCYQGT